VDGEFLKDIDQATFDDVMKELGLSSLGDQVRLKAIMREVAAGFLTLPGEHVTADPWSLRPPTTWTVEDVCEWLNANGLGVFEESFRKERIAGDVLMEAEYDERCKIGTLKDRKLLRIALKKLGEKANSALIRTIGQIEYMGPISFADGYVPEKACRDHMLDDLASVLPDVTQMPWIVAESSKFAESRLQHLRTGVVRLGFDEALAIAAYTYDLAARSTDLSGDGKDNLYYGLNAMLRERSPGKMAKLQPYLAYLMRGLARLEAVRATTYRGVPASAAGMVRERYNDGVPVHWSGFTSTTTDLSEAKRFALKEGPGGVVFRIACRSGRSVAVYSAIPKECEVLLLPNTKLVVMPPAGDGADDLGVTFVDLVEQADAAIRF
jgi:hypothetical protein